MNHNRNVWNFFKDMKNVFLNTKNKIYLWFLNKFVADADEYYSITEPPIEWMTIHNKTFWIQPCKEEELE